MSLNDHWHSLDRTKLITENLYDRNPVGACKSLGTPWEPVVSSTSCVMMLLLEIELLPLDWKSNVNFMKFLSRHPLLQFKINIWINVVLVINNGFLENHVLQHFLSLYQFHVYPLLLNLFFLLYEYPQRQKELWDNVGCRFRCGHDRSAPIFFMNFLIAIIFLKIIKYYHVRIDGNFIQILGCFSQASIERAQVLVISHISQFFEMLHMIVLCKSCPLWIELKSEYTHCSYCVLIAYTGTYICVEWVEKFT